MSHYQARSLFGSSHRLTSRQHGLGLDRYSAMDRGVGVTIGCRLSSVVDNCKVKEVDGEPLLDANGLKALIRLLRLAEPLGKGLLRVLLNLCAHGVTRSMLVHFFLTMVNPDAQGIVDGLSVVNSQRLYGCPANVVYGRSQLLDGFPPLVLCRVLETLTYLATNHAAVANILFYFDPSVRADVSVQEIFTQNMTRARRKLQVMTLVQVIIFTAASKLQNESPAEQAMDSNQVLRVSAALETAERAVTLTESESKEEPMCENGLPSSHQEKDGNKVYHIFLKLPPSDLRNVCCLLGLEGLWHKVYLLAVEVLKKLASVAAVHRKFSTSELSELAQVLSGAAVGELITLKNTGMMGLSAGSMAGVAMLRVLQALHLLAFSGPDGNKNLKCNQEQENHVIMQKLNISLESSWHELSDCISTMETTDETSQTAGSLLSPPLPPGMQRLLLFIEAFFPLCEKLQSNNSTVQLDHASVTATEVKESSVCFGSSPSTCGVDSQRRLDGSVTFSRFAEKHRSLLNAFIRQNPEIDLNDLKANTDDHTGYTAASNIVQWFILSARFLQFVTGTSKVPYSALHSPTSVH
ncbi:E3 ubiquitin-protein ligase upl1 [Dionaea muscipula]